MICLEGGYKNNIINYKPLQQGLWQLNIPNFSSSWGTSNHRVYLESCCYKINEIFPVSLGTLWVADDSPCLDPPLILLFGYKLPVLCSLSTLQPCLGRRRHHKILARESKTAVKGVQRLCSGEVRTSSPARK